MVQVITEKPARPIADVESTSSVDEGDDNQSWTPDVTTGLPPGSTPGDILVWDGDSWVPGAASSGGMVPYYLAPDETFVVPLYKQALFAMLIDNAGTLAVDGYLLEVD